MGYPHIRSHNPLLVLRGIAILSILWFHIIPMTYSLIPFWGYDVSQFVFWDGVSGVWIFLMLSGYLMGKKFLSDGFLFRVSSVTRFYWSRIKKIFPAYYIVLFATLLCFTPFPFNNKEDIVRFLTFRATQLSSPDVIAYLWFVSLIVQLYIVSPFFWVVSQYVYKKSFFLLVGISCLFPCISVLYRMGIYFSIQPMDPTVWTALFHKQTFVAIDMFLMGMMLNYLLLYIQKNTTLSRYISKNVWIEPWLKGVSIGLVVCVSILSAHTLYRFHHDYTGTAFFYGTILPGIVMAATGLFIVVFELFERKNRTERISQSIFHPLTFIAWIGTLSYELYLVHYPIIIASTKISGSSLFCVATCTVPTFVFHYGLLLTFSLIAALVLKQCIHLCGYCLYIYTHIRRKR